MYLRSESYVSCDISSAEKSSDELSDSNTESNNKQMHETIPKIGSYKPLDLPSGFELPKQFGSKVVKKLQECRHPGSVPADVQRAFIRQVTMFFLFIQQFVLGDHNLDLSAHLTNSYHESIQTYLVFSNSL